MPGSVNGYIPIATFYPTADFRPETLYQAYFYLTYTYDMQIVKKDNYS